MRTLILMIQVWIALLLWLLNITVRFAISYRKLFLRVLLILFILLITFFPIPTILIIIASFLLVPRIILRHIIKGIFLNILTDILASLQLLLQQTITAACHRHIIQLTEGSFQLQGLLIPNLITFLMLVYLIRLLGMVCVLPFVKNLFPLHICRLVCLSVSGR